jgi:hypothetical protein
MPVDSSAVQIVINVVDQNSGQVISDLTQKFGNVGAAGTRTGQQIRKGMEEAGAGAMSAVEKTRLLEESFGIRMPRAFLRLAAESKALQTTMSALGGVMTGLAGIEIGWMLGSQAIEGAQKLYEKFFDVTSAVR